jgi:hypothetical protein
MYRQKEVVDHPGMYYSTICRLINKKETEISRNKTLVTTANSRERLHSPDINTIDRFL